MSHPNPHGKNCFWSSLAEDFGAPNVKWCERTLCEVISEPANMWSNVAYLLVAILIYRESKSQWQSGYANAVLFMGFSSLIYHMSNVFLSQMIDFIGMYVFVGYLMFHNLNTLGKQSSYGIVRFLTFFVGGMSTVTFVLHGVGVAYQLLIALGAAAILITEWKIAKQVVPKNSDYLALFFSSVLICVAVGFTAMDKMRVLCFPDNHLIQGHALWHVFSAAAVYYYYIAVAPRYCLQRSEGR